MSRGIKSSLRTSENQKLSSSASGIRVMVFEKRCHLYTSGRRETLLASECKEHHGVSTCKMSLVKTTDQCPRSL